MLLHSPPQLQANACVRHRRAAHVCTYLKSLPSLLTSPAVCTVHIP